ncbi:hypothetical protein [Vogesella indigofera]|uniref:hypothetical protein n=1 Tax=Vogesella indigofera TaxID=45465 RepID=UPI00234E951D|nr:hypothetical protein [Vogesella indigofera]MDC7709040.1 hypothetical protein [Vogesella indigofera]
MATVSTGFTPWSASVFIEYEEIIDADDDLHDEAQLQSTLLTDLSEHPFRRWRSLLPPRRIHYHFTVLDEHFERDIQRALAGLQEIFLTYALPRRTEGRRLLNSLANLQLL